MSAAAPRSAFGSKLSSKVAPGNEPTGAPVAPRPAAQAWGAGSGAAPGDKAHNIMRLAQLFPECVYDSAPNGVPALKVDVTKLLARLGLNSYDSYNLAYLTDAYRLSTAPEAGGRGAESERYQLCWPGKAAAREQAYAPLAAPQSLQLDLTRSSDFERSANLFFEGDNLTVLKLLQHSYRGAIKFIYLDPPYNSGSNELVYHDQFRERSGSRNKAGATAESERMARGQVHAPWCSMLYQCLLLAAPLLSADGAIFVSIDEREVANLRLIMDEVLGEDNFVSTLVWKKKQGGSNDSGYVVTDHEYILVYAKALSQVALGLDFGANPDARDYPYCDEHGRYNLITLDKSSLRFSPSLIYAITGPDGTVYHPRIIKGKQACWRWSADKVAQNYDQLVFKDGKVYTKNYLKAGEKPRSLLIDSERFGRTSRGKADLQELFTSCPFSYPKPVRLISYLISLMQGNDFTVLDLFAGSGTTAQAVMELNAADGGTRSFIMVQRPEPLKLSASAAHSTVVSHDFATLSALAIERIRRAGARLADECTKIVRGGGTQFTPQNQVAKTDKYRAESASYGLLSGLELALSHSDLPQNGADKAVAGADLDLGLRVFTLRSESGAALTNDASAAELARLFTTLVHLGLPLHQRLECLSLGTYRVWSYGTGALMACFAPVLDDGLLAQLASLEQAPQQLLLGHDALQSAQARDDYLELCAVLLPLTTVLWV